MKQKLKWTLVGLVGLYLLIGFLVIPLVLQKKLPEIVSEVTGGEFSVESISFNPLIARLEVDGIRLLDPEGESFFTMGQLMANVNVLSLLRGAVHIQDVELFEPSTSIVHNEDGSFNFDWLTQSKAPKEKVESEEDNSSSGAMPRLLIDRFAVVSGKAAYADMTKKKPFEVELGPVGFELKDIDTGDIKEDDDNIHIYTHISDGGFIDIKSDVVSVEPPALRGSVVFESGALYTDWKYIQEQFRLEVADGKLHLQFDFDVDMADLDAMKVDQLQFALKNLRVKPKSAHDDVLRIGLFAVDNATIEPMKQQVGIEGIRIDDVDVFAKRYADGSIDWQHYTAPVENSDEQNVTETAEETTESNASETSEPWLVMLDSFSMKRIKAKFDDQAVVPNVTTTMDDFSLDATHISSQGGIPLDYNLSLLVNKAMTCEGSGTVEHTPLDINASTACQALDLTWFRPYIDQAANKALDKFDIALTHGKIALDSGVLVHETADTMAIQTYDTDFELSKLTLRQASNKALLLRLERLGIDDIKADTLKQELMIDDFVLKHPAIYARRDKGGEIDWAGVVVPKAATQERSATKKSKRVEKADASEEDAAWKVGLDRFALNQGGVTFTDNSLSAPAKSLIDWIEFEAKGISSEEKSRLSYKSSLRINKTGRLFTKGSLVHTPLAQQGSIYLKKFQLSDLDPYIQENAYVSIERGALTIKAEEAYAPSKRRPDLDLKGSLSIKDFVANDTHDDSVLFAFEDITIDPFLFQNAPNKLYIEEIGMKTLYANVIIDENKTMNFADLVKVKEEASKDVEEAPKAAPEEEKSEPFPVTIVKVAVDGSSTSFADLSLPLRFRTYVHDVGGTVYAISSNPKETTKIDMKGVIDQYGFAKIGGALNSADPKQYTDIDLSFENLALNNYSPYSAEFAGRKIDSGKLNIDLGYKINKSALLGSNSVVIDKLELGDDVESEDAMNLPLGLAIALLEDSDGIIDIDMPVEGDLANPDFKYGATVWKAFTNMITGIVAAPFNFLGSMLGIEGEELKAIAFDPGASELLPPEKEKLDTLAKALDKRPRLKLGVTGAYDEKSDRHALQYAKAVALFMQQLDPEKLKKDETIAIPIAEDIVEDAYGDDVVDEMQDRLEEQYEDDDEYDRQYFDELKAKIIGMQEVSQAELEQLATTRAKTISTYLETETMTAPDRIKLEAISPAEDSGEESVENQLSIEIDE